MQNVENNIDQEIKHTLYELKTLTEGINTNDLAELAKIHEYATKLSELANKLPAQLADLLTKFTHACANITEGIILEEYPNPEELLKKLADTIHKLYEQSTTSNISELRNLIDWMKDYQKASSTEKSTNQSTEETTQKEENHIEENTQEDPENKEDSSAEVGAEYNQRPLIISKEEIEYVKSFLTESEEHIEAIENGLLELEQSPDDPEKINDVFRPFHTIKGMAGFLNLHNIQTLTHELETLLDKGRKGKLTITPEIIDIIFDGLDILKLQINEISEYISNPTGQPIPQPPITDFLKRIKSLDKENPSQTSHKKVPMKLGEILVEDKKVAPEVIEHVIKERDKKHQGKPLGEILKDKGLVTTRDVDKALRKQKMQESVVRVDTQKLDSLVNLAGELVIAQAQIEGFEEIKKNSALFKLIELTFKITRDIQEIGMSMRMVPIAYAFQKMGRVVRDLTRKMNKKIQLVIEGEETELDKNVIQELTDPLMHMVRNAIDHGIESPEERISAGKPETGVITLRAYHQGGNIIIEISDDGKGLDKEKIFQKAVEKGLIDHRTELTDQQIFNLIFTPGFSTASEITDVSGRGVGMDVVKKNIEKLRGTIDIDSQVGKGTTFKIRLPLTLAVIDGMVVRVGTQRFIIPTLSIIRALVPQKEQINSIQGKTEILVLQDKLYPLIKLAEVFRIPDGCTDPSEGIVVIVQSIDKEIGIVLDELLGQQQVVIKSLGEQIKTVKGISGGAILGDGNVGLIIDPSSLGSLCNEPVEPAAATL